MEVIIKYLAPVKLNYMNNMIRTNYLIVKSDQSSCANSEITICPLVILVSFDCQIENWLP